MRYTPGWEDNILNKLPLLKMSINSMKLNIKSQQSFKTVCFDQS